MKYNKSPSPPYFQARKPCEKNDNAPTDDAIGVAQVFSKRFLKGRTKC